MKTLTENMKTDKKIENVHEAPVLISLFRYLVIHKITIKLALFLNVKILTYYIELRQLE